MNNGLKINTWLAALSGDLLLDQVIKGGAVSMAVRVIGTVASLASHLVLSRFLGAREYGHYVIALGWAMVLIVPARFGLENTTLRFATIYREEQRSGALRALVHTSLATISATSIGLAMLLLGSKLANAPFLDAVEFNLLVWVAAMVFPLAILGWLSTLIRTVQKILASQFYEQVLRPMLLIAALALFLRIGIQLDSGTAMKLTVVCTAAAMIGLAVHTFKAFRGLLNAAYDFSEWRLWFSVSWAVLLMSVVQETSNQIEIILLGILADATSAAHFSAAWRLASLVSFGLVAIATVSAPLIASAFRRGDIAEMARLAKLNARLSFGFAISIAIFIAVFGKLLLGAFGPDFVQAYPALLILLAGGIANAFTGSAQYFLLMTGHQIAALAIMFVSLVLGIVLNGLLIPLLGLTGSAIASASCVIFWNMTMLIFVRRTLGVDASVLAVKPKYLPDFT